MKLHPLDLGNVTIAFIRQFNVLHMPVYLVLRMPVVLVLTR
jgi:hypothetical protein